DAAHKVMTEALARGEELPVDWTNQMVYYLGPTPAKPGDPIGSCGPTTSGRMDAYTPTMLEQGIKGMIGKGSRSQAVVDSMKYLFQVAAIVQKYDGECLVIFLPVPLP
ncbi:MAG: fumarate hydratase subunit beta, partial [Actinomycetota bacterium]